MSEPRRVARPRTSRPRTSLHALASPGLPCLRMAPCRTVVMMRVEQVKVGSTTFASVIKLWRGESATLGFMPEGGFVDAARAGTLLAVVSADAELAGYVMFRQSRDGVVAITHLCVDPRGRGKGTARLLFEAMKARSMGCHEIRLRCRRDFGVNDMWPKLGFIAVDEVRGRAKEGLLTVWQHHLCDRPLFKMFADCGAASGAERAVIDANVFFDLDEQGPGHPETEGLQADWIGESLELAVTAELFNEINRRDDRDQRERSRVRASRFLQVPRDQAQEEAARQRIKNLVRMSTKKDSQSDVAQLAMTAAGGVSFFITRDQEILDEAEAIRDAVGVQVGSPHEFVCRFDELRRAHEYEPRRLALGPRAASRLARAGDVERLADLVHVGEAASEPRRRTVARLRMMIACPDRFAATCIEKDGELLAAYVIDRERADLLSVPYLGVAPSPLGVTAARHYAENLLLEASKLQRKLVLVESISPRVQTALSELGFSREEEGWVKIALPLALPPAQLADEVEQLAATSPPAAPLATRVASDLRCLASGPGLSRAGAASIERALWPAKLTSVGLPSYVVPIKPRWAKDLFDRDLAEGTLFGADPSLILNSENVYYRAARPGVIEAPGRVLWYVSSDVKYPGAMAIRACSLVEEVVVGPPKELFRRFRRLGVYEWNDVFQAAKGDVSTEIMAFRFSRTELFPAAIPWEKMRSVLESHGNQSTLQSPVAISEACFLELYSMGTATRAA